MFDEAGIKKASAAAVGRVEPAVGGFLHRRPGEILGEIAGRFTHVIFTISV